MINPFEHIPECTICKGTGEHNCLECKGFGCQECSGEGVVRCECQD